MARLPKGDLVVRGHDKPIHGIMLRSYIEILISHYMDPYETMWEGFFSMAHVNRESQPT